MSKRVHPTKRRSAVVVDLGQFREQLQRANCRQRIEETLSLHRDALRGVFESGLVYTRRGSRVARELLQSQQMLMRAKDLLAREARLPVCGEAVLQKLRQDVDELLERASATAKRHKVFFS